MKIKSGFLSLIGVLSINFFCGEARAFVPTVDPRTTKPILSEDDQISLANPLTHGDFMPRLTGELGSVNLRLDDKSFNWLATKSDRGVLQTWGRPFMVFQSDDTLTEMDATLRRFIQQNYDSFQVSTAELKLDKERTKFSGPYRYITYTRFYRNEDEVAMPVEGAFITFRFKFGVLVQITNFTFGKIGLDERPAVSQEDAIDAVVQDSGFVSSQDSFSGKIVTKLQPFYTPRGEIKFRHVHQIGLRKQNGGGLWQYSVSAHDGRIVRLMNLLHTAGHLSAEVLARLPSDQLTQVSLSETNIRKDGKVSRTDAEGNYDFDSEGVTAELSGVRAMVKQSARRLPIERAQSDGEILFSAEKNLSENMGYFYVSRVNAFVRNFVKSAPYETAKGKVDFLNSPMTVNTRASNAQIKSCNAWFDPGDKTLNFLEADSKCEASSHFSDIIFHEWGHALDDAFGGIQDDAFSEAIGDVAAALMTGDSRIGPGFVKGQERPIRDIGSVKIYPRDRARDPHTESLIVSGAWYESLQAMKKVYGDDDGRMKTAELFYKHLITTDSYLDSYMGALTVDDDNGNISDCTPNMCILNVAFARRGIAKADPRCFSEDVQGNLPACAPSTVRPPRID